MKISVMGSGRWGTFIAWYLDHVGHSVKLYGLAGSPSYQELQQKGSNGLVRLPETMELTWDPEDAVNSCEVMVISVGAQNLRGFMQEMKSHRLEGKTIVLCMKGIEDETGKRLTQVVNEFIDPQRTSLAVWVGPGHPQDLMRGVPNCMVIDSCDRNVQKQLIEGFSSDLIRFYYGSDLIGNELGAALKNVVGIAAGMLDGMDKTALKGALMARGTREVAKLIHALGGNPMSAYGLAHLGDYQATVFSEFSHNRMFGEKFIKKEQYDKLAEGVFTAKAVTVLAQQAQIDMPICRGVYEVLYEDKDPGCMLHDLFMRTIKEEF